MKDVFWCRLLLKSLLNFFFFTILLLLYVLTFWPPGKWDLSSLTKDQTHSLCLGRQSLNHWSTREIPVISFLLLFLQSHVGFCHTTRINHSYPFSLSLLSLPPLPLSRPSRSSHGTRLGPLCHIATSHQLSILPLTVYLCWCYSVMLRCSQARSQRHKVQEKRHLWDFILRGRYIK